MALENPFQDPLRFETRMPECAIVIFGASGPLTKRRLMPALYRLAYDRRLAAGFAVIGVSRTPLGDDGFREKMREAVRSFSEDTTFDEDVWKAFARGLFYVAGDAGDAALFGRLAQKLAEIEQARHTGGNALFYLSLQPSQYAPAALGLGGARLEKGNGWRRLVVEKPFGHDLASARELSGQIHQVFDESDVYRIDHYLGKETVQNILAMRFGNGIFEPLWNRRYVNHVQITAAESIGGEGRGADLQGAVAYFSVSAIRQRDFRAPVEPALREPRADYGGRIDRRRGTGRVLPGSRRAGGHDPEPSAPGNGDRKST